MPFEKVPDVKPSEKGPIPFPEEISPTVYLQTFVEWLQAKPSKGNRNTVKLTLVRFYSFATDKLGIVTYGEIGQPGDDSTMTLQMTADRKLHLKGEATIYKNDQRLMNTITQPTGNFPFNPSNLGSMEVIIWVATGEINLQIKPNKWKILPKYAAASNLLYGFPSDHVPPLPMVILSLSKIESPVSL